MEPNPYQSPESAEDYEDQYEPPWDDEAEKATRKKWAKGIGIAAIVVLATPVVGIILLVAAQVVELVVYIIYRLVTGE